MNKGSARRNEDAFNAVQAMLEHIRRDGDPDGIQDSIRFRFGSANALFAADRNIWQQLGLKPNDALLMSRFSEISRYVDQTRFNRRSRLNTPELATEYLVSNFHGLQIERFYMLCLDKRGCLKEKVLLFEGTADSTLFNLNRLLVEALRISPAAVILSHNHPGGTQTPSQEDISSTADAIRALNVMQIPVLDHLIIAGNKGISMRLNGFIPECYWIAQQPDNKLLLCWAASGDEPILNGKRKQRTQK